MSDLIAIESDAAAIDASDAQPIVDIDSTSFIIIEPIDADVKTETISKSEPESISSEDNQSVETNKLNGQSNNEMTGMYCTVSSHASLM